MPIPPTAAAAQARSISALGRLSVTHARVHVPMSELESLYRGGARGYLRSRIARWVTLLPGLVAMVFVPWTLYLTFTLPPRHVTLHYDLAWVGFDVALACAFAATTWRPSAARTGSSRSPPSPGDARLRRVVRGRHHRTA